MVSNRGARIEPAQGPAESPCAGRYVVAGAGAVSRFQHRPRWPRPVHETAFRTSQRNFFLFNTSARRSGEQHPPCDVRAALLRVRRRFRTHQTIARPQGKTESSQGNQWVQGVVDGVPP